MSQLITAATPGGRFSTKLDNRHLTKNRRVKKLTMLNQKHSGRNAQGIITTRHQGGRHKRFLRIIDWKRDKFDVPGVVMAIEYDPNRTANIAFVQYEDGDKRYIIAPEGLQVGQTVLSGENATYEVGNTLPLSKIPLGTFVHNIELTPGKGAQLGRSAGTVIIVQGREEAMVLVKLASGEVRRLHPSCLATIGQVSNPAWKNVVIGKAGRNRLRGRRPGVRGTAQHPGSHPHGGGEGRSGIGMTSPKTPWGKKALGKKTRNPKKYSNSFIVQRRNSTISK